MRRAKSANLTLGEGRGRESVGEINIGSFYFISALLFRRGGADKWTVAGLSRGIVGLMKRDAYIRLLEALLAVYRRLVSAAGLTRFRWTLMVPSDTGVKRCTPIVGRPDAEDGGP